MSLKHKDGTEGAAIWFPSFPYAGIIRFRFEGLISGLAATPNGILNSGYRPGRLLSRRLH